MGEGLYFVNVAERLITQKLYDLTVAFNSKERKTGPGVVLSTLALGRQGR